MIIVLSTYPDRKSADKAAMELVERKLAACVSRIKLENSVYRWEGKIERHPEFLLLAKTTSKAYTRLERQIKKTHPHSVPEIVYLEVKGGQKDYLDWVRKNALPGF
jgi:periplasmic divalent cation tolerance protein